MPESCPLTGDYDQVYRRGRYHAARSTLLVFADVEYLQVMVDVPARLRPGLNEGMMLQAQLMLVIRWFQSESPRFFNGGCAAAYGKGEIRPAQVFPHQVCTPGAGAGFYCTGSQLSGDSSSAIRYNGCRHLCRGTDGQPELRLIRVGENLDGGYTSVLSGLSEGERVLRNPGSRSRRVGQPSQKLNRRCLFFPISGHSSRCTAMQWRPVHN